MTDNEIKTLVAQFEDQRDARHRYASFDYCFNYFRAFKETGRLKELVEVQNIEKSCLQLGFYLASWGMFRMSGKLGQKVNARHFCELIREISTWENGHRFSRVWDIDAQDYADKETQKLLIECFEKIGPLIVLSEQKARRTLVTKVMLGIFGCVPAFDDLFTQTFKRLYGKEKGCAFTQFNDDALLTLDKFYGSHRATIDELAAAKKTLDFETGKATQRCYKKAKIIDMIGFQEGKNKSDEEKAKKKAEQVAANGKGKAGS